MLSRIQQVARNRGGRFNPYALGLVTEAYAKNSAHTVDDIYYRTNGVSGSIFCYVPILDKLALYYFLNDAGGVKINNLNEVGTPTPEFVSLSYKNYDSKTGTGWTTTAPNQFATVVGSTITFTVTGVTKISFYSYVDNRGGLWNFKINGGNDIPISVYRATGGYRETIIYDTLTASETYTIVGTFAGQDPANPVASPRGWVYYGDNSTTGCFRLFGTEIKYIRDTYVMPVSNVEFAIDGKVYGASYAGQFAPYHGTVTTSINSNLIKIDNVVLTDFTNKTYLKKCQKIEIIQDFNVFNTNEPSIVLYNVKAAYTIDKYGYLVDYTVTGIVKSDLSGYLYMLPVHRIWATKLTTDAGNEYNLTKSDAIAVAILNQDSIRSMKVTSSINNAYEITSSLIHSKALRIGKPDRGSPAGNIMWIENRNDPTINKNYLSSLKNTILEAGESIRVRNIYYIGKA